MKKQRLIIFLALLCLMSASYAKTSSTAHLSYRIILDGKGIGEMRLSHIFHDNGKLEDIALVSTANISGWWGDWSMQTQSRFQFDNATPVNFVHRINENDQSHYIHGERQGSELWASVTEVKTQKQLSDEEFVGTALSITSQFVPAIGTAMSVGALLSDEDPTKGQKIAMKDFDLTEEQISAYISQQGYNFVDHAVKILNTETLKIEQYVMNTKGKMVLSLADRAFDCHVIHITGKGRDTTYWIAEENDHAFLIKETGKDSGDAYEVRLKNIIWE